MIVNISNLVKLTFISIDERIIYQFIVLILKLKRYKLSFEHINTNKLIKWYLKSKNNYFRSLLIFKIQY